MVACFAEGLNFDNIVADDTTKYALFHVLQFFIFNFSFWLMNYINFISIMSKKNSFELIILEKNIELKL